MESLVRLFMHDREIRDKAVLKDKGNHLCVYVGLLNSRSSFCSLIRTISLTCLLTLLL